MTLFSADLYRNFAIGFGAGALIVGAAVVADGRAELESPARAAAPIEAPLPADEFLIEPLEIAE